MGRARRSGWGRDANLPPLDAFTNVRAFEVGAPGWWLMDTVGMDALFLPDLEACVPPGCDLDEVASWLRNVQLALLDKGPVLHAGHHLRGPGGRWVAMKASDEGLASPPRPTLRWAPEGMTLPGALSA